MASVLTQMIRGERPAWPVAEDAHHIAFLEMTPSAPGHVICLPKTEIPSLFDMEEADYLALMQFVRRVSLALETVVPCQKIGLSVIGLKTPHAHVHLVPLQTMDDILFKNTVDTGEDYFPRLQSAISAAFNAQ